MEYISCRKYGINLLYCVLVFIPKWSTGMLCYSCKDVLNTETCLNVTECPSGEVCYGRADGFQSAEVKHTLGCTKELVVPSRTGINGCSFCSSTCRESLCNLKECQIGKVNRPPRCVLCGLVDSPNDCRNVTQCQQGEICLTERIETFGKAKYRLGCVKDHYCSMNIQNTLPVIGKRTSVNHCAVCCKTDHCNIDACNANTTARTFQLTPLLSNAPCEDLDPKLCATLGRFNTNACSDAYVVEKCPKSCKACDHIGWSEWQTWGACSQSCGLGVITRKRYCDHRLGISLNRTCVGSPTEQKACNIVHCPVNGGWCKVTHETCAYQNHGCTSRTEITSCTCPTPKYGGLYCR